MTRREQLKEINVDLDDKLVKKLEETGLSLGTALEGYIDAIDYGWEQIIEENPKAQALYTVRTMLMEKVHEIDEQLDDIAEGKTE